MITHLQPTYIKYTNLFTTTPSGMKRVFTGHTNREYLCCMMLLLLTLRVIVLRLIEIFIETTAVFQFWEPKEDRYICVLWLSFNDGKHHNSQENSPRENCYTWLAHFQRKTCHAQLTVRVAHFLWLALLCTTRGPSQYKDAVLPV